MDFSGFLFGNINEEGELEDDRLLDKDSVAGLSRLGIGLGSVIGELKCAEEEESDGSEEGIDDKAHDAEDFADINEVALDEDSMQLGGASSPQTTPSSSHVTQATPSSSHLTQEPLSSLATISTLSASAAAQQPPLLSSQDMFSSSRAEEDEDYDLPSPPDSHKPPQTTPIIPSSLPPLPSTLITTAPSPTQSSSTSSCPPITSPSSYPPTTNSIPTSLPATVPSPREAMPPGDVMEVGQENSSLLLVQDDELNMKEEGRDMPLMSELSQPAVQDKPGGGGGVGGELSSAIPALIPENMTLEQLRTKVKKLFPGFSSHRILRFSSLLGPGKLSSQPRIWREAKKPKRKRKKESLINTLTLNVNFDPSPELGLMSDDEEKFLSMESPKVKPSMATESSSKLVGRSPSAKGWRNGPAKLWYDSIGVPEDAYTLDYGFKLKKSDDSPPSPSSPPQPEGEAISDSAFMMVSQEHWEDKIIRDVPTLSVSGVQPWRSLNNSLSSPSFSSLPRPLVSGRGLPDGGGTDSTLLQDSLFPIDNFQLTHCRWEDQVIMDAEAMESIPSPSVPLIDPNDSNFIIGVPEEPPPSSAGDKDSRKESKKQGRGGGGGGGGRGKGSSDSNPVSCFQTSKRDPFNISNDEYYNPKHVSTSQGLSGLDGTVVQHSTPALDLHPPWFPTQLSSSALRHFHRPKLRIRCPQGDQSTGWYSVSSLEKHVALKAKEREVERAASGGGEVFFMRTPEDLSACDGHLILSEYSEQYPPVLSALGLATKIKNYYRRSERQMKSHTPELAYGETTYVQNTSYFLGQLKPGQVLQSFENHLYRSPIYQHVMPETDFLLIVVGNEVYIRDPPQIFVVGQECPKLEVPAPNSKPATQFQRELLQVFLYQQFRESEETPKKLKMDVIRKAFPASIMSESVIRKVLKTCADFKREGYENGWWVLRHDFRLPTDEELRSLITPEQVCVYHSMLAAEHRLKEAGYRGKSLFVVEEDEEEDSINKMDDEVRAAPWNTTHHFINASKGKYQLSVSGPADPTGCGEGFSYTRLNTKREASNHLAASKKYKNVMGTDGDLRKLKLSKAKSLLRNFGVREDEISKLSRWQVIDKVRELSTEAARSGDGVDVMNLKFARGARFSQMEALERYRDECQKMFDLQNSVLSSAEVLSTDEESSGGEDESDNELGRNLETLLQGKKTTAQLNFEQEEAERVELRRFLSEDRPSRTPECAETSDRGTPVGLAADGDDTSSIRSLSLTGGKHLIISRTFHDEEGREFVRDEVVKRPDVINAYVQLSSEVRSKFVDQDEQTREDMKKMKRKLQDQLRRIKKQEEKEKKKAQKPQKQKPLTTIKMKCSACGQKGHMKTNRNCPMYKNNPVNVAPTDLELAQAETSIPQDDLVKVEGTKVVLNKALVEHAQDVRRKSLLLKFPKAKSRKRRRGPQDEDLEYLERKKSIQRRKTNPEVPFSDHLEKVLLVLINLPESFHFRKPVNPKNVPDYYNVIKFPMDLQTMREHCRKQIYKSRDQFREHINLIITNCVTYNGSGTDVTRHAQHVAEVCEEELAKLQVELEQLEAEINPALDDNALVAFSYVLGKTVDCMKAVPDSWPFHHPVSSKKIPDYHKIIKSPMDLQTLKKKCLSRQYLNQETFLADLNQIVENSITYNGPSSSYTQTAEQMKVVGILKLQEDANLLRKLERRVSGTSSPAPLLKLLEGSQPLEDETLLLEDLQHSSSSEDSESEDSEEDMDRELGLV